MSQEEQRVMMYENLLRKEYTKMGETSSKKAIDEEFPVDDVSFEEDSENEEEKRRTENRNQSSQVELPKELEDVEMSGNFVFDLLEEDDNEEKPQKTDVQDSVMQRDNLASSKHSKAMQSIKGGKTSRKTSKLFELSEFPEDVSEESSSRATPDKIPDSSESLGHQDILTFEALKREEAKKYDRKEDNQGSFQYNF
jgi:hypothetical protein